MMIPDEKLELYAVAYITQRALRMFTGRKQESFCQYLQRQQGASNMKNLCINRHPLPLMARIRRTVRRWLGKGKHHAA